MNIQEKYNIEETLNTFSLCPKKPSLAMSRWFLAGIVFGVVLLLFFNHFFDEVMRYVIGIFIAYFICNIFYNIIIGSKIQYTFDANANAVYKKSPIRSKRKLMKLEDSVIFVHSEMGSWNYALGAQKSQFVKNYSISESFTSGRKSEAKQQAYEDFVLTKIDRLIASVTKQV